jgi:lipoprotein-anchoring transpeptidase ErfK/SrfK
VRRTIALAVAGLALVLASPASAQEAATITLEASSTKVPLGDEVALSGVLTPAAAGRAVQIRDEADDIVATATTDAQGSFAATISPERTLTLRAVWQTIESEPVMVRVSPAITLEMSPVRLFDTVSVRGSVTPAVPDASIEVVLLRSGRRVETTTAELHADGGFRTRFRIMSPGRYRVRAIYSDEVLARGSALSSSDLTPLPALHAGSRGAFVRLLEQRLAELHYRIVGVNRSYDHRTADAVVAFRKVQGMTRTFAVDRAVWRALADPRVLRPRIDARGSHIEVDQTRQVLYTVVDGDVTNVIHVSTGAGGATHDGFYRVYRKLAGFSPNHLYYPSYFDGLRAIHGWTEVPTYAASHGCVRVPYWNARWIFGLASVGTRIVIYHS